MVNNMSDTTGYEAAHGGAAFITRPAAYVRVAGPNAFDFLQRQTTNDVRLVEGGAAQVNVLADATARIVQVFTLRGDGEGYGLLAQPGQGGSLADYLRGKIFFMDNVTVEAASDDRVAIELVGPDASDAAVAGAAAGGVLVSAGGVPPVLLVPTAEAAAVESALREAGAVPMTAEEAQVVRVEQGRPAVGAELDGAYTPLEVGLGAAVSDTKGCYTGQEVLARQVTYDKVVRSLVGLSLDEPVQPGAEVIAEGKRAGAVTSAVVSPRYGAIALAVLRRPYDTPGSVVQAADEHVSGGAVVRALPFGHVED